MLFNRNILFRVLLIFEIDLFERILLVVVMPPDEPDRAIRPLSQEQFFCELARLGRWQRD